MGAFQDAFISYGRADSKFFAMRLNERLMERGYNVWFDFDDIPLAVDFQNQIDAGIEQAHNFLFVIAPHSINSEYCRKEVELAVRLNKRIIPLLHVEEIDRETWQSRFPDGTDDDWEFYRQAGKHSSFPNMHPVIGKLNWIYLRDGKDSFDESFESLLKIFERHEQYVHQHTYFLNKALEWERHQKQNRYLLIQEDRLQAEEWLRYRFKDEQPPCIPTDLHCEFITESTKNAENLMTQVFLSYSDHDRPFMEDIRKVLMRESFTVWTNTQDIKTGSDFQEAINRGIEEADNLVYMISPDSLRSPYCQAEIEYARQLNKRIIPLLIRPTEMQEIPAELRSLQFINFTDNQNEGDRQRDLEKIVTTIRQDAAYYEYHKLLLAKALKWDRQHRNPSLLLRGYNLRHAASWLDVAKRRAAHRPTDLQIDFINESLRQPTGTAVDVFVSYSRRNSDFARQLNDGLQIQGKTTWFDQESLAAGATDFEAEIYRGIESANHFLFIISPSAIASPYCASEVEYAAKLNKRIITVLHQPVNPNDLPPALACVQWIDFNQHNGDFNANFNILMRALDTDPEYLRAHTRLLMRALEWDQKKRDDSFLLRGSDLNEAEAWLLESEGKSPPPTSLQQEYITDSRQTESARQAAEIKRQRLLLRLQRVGMVVVVVFSLVSLKLWRSAQESSNQANQSKTMALKEQVTAQTLASEALFKSDQPFEALLQGMQAADHLKDYHLENDVELNNQVKSALQDALFWAQERNRVAEAHNGIIWEVSTSADGELIASASADKTVRLWKKDGTLVSILPNNQGRQIYGVAFAPEGDRVATAGEDGYIELWQTDGDLIRMLPSNGSPIAAVSFSPDGQLIASAGEDGTIKLWREEGTVVKTLEGHSGPVRFATFSPDGQTLASAGDDGTVRLWSVLEGRLLKTLRGHTAQVLRVRFSPDGQKLVSASWDNTVRLWGVDGTPLLTIEAHESPVNDASFSPDGSFLISASTDKTIKMWTLSGHMIKSLMGHDSEVRSIAFLRGDRLVSGGGDRALRIWQLHHPLLHSLEEHHAKVYAVDIDPQAQLIATGGADNNVRLWDYQGKLLQTLRGHSAIVWDVNFSPDGQVIASTSSDFSVKLWRQDGTLITTLTEPNGPVRDVTFSPDGQYIAAVSTDCHIYLWRWDGQKATFVRSIEHRKGLLAVTFSPDGKYIAAGGWDNQAKLWSLDGNPVLLLGSKPGVVNGHSGWVYDIAFSPDGQTIATASYDNTIKLWSVESGRVLKTLTGHSDGVSSIDFNADGTRLISTSFDHTVKLWSVDGTLLSTLHGHGGGVTDAAFSADNRMLVTASLDQTAQIWDTTILDSLDSLVHQGCIWLEDYANTQAVAQNIDLSMCK